MRFFLAVLGGLMVWAGPAMAADYVFILKSRGNPYWTAVVQGMEETAKRENMDASIHQIANDSAAEEQLNLCETLISQKPKVLAISAVNTSVGIQCMKKAQAQGIIVADLDSNVSVEEAKAVGIPLAFTVGSNNYDIGKNAALYAAKELPEGAKILLLEGAVGSIPGNKRRDGFREGLQKARPDAQIVSSVSADWDRLKAFAIVADSLLAHPDLKLIYACNDLMGLGAVEAVQGVGKGSDIQIIAVDGTADARKAILAGRMKASVAQLPYLIGQRAVELALAAGKGAKPGVAETVPTPVLTKEVLEEGRDPILRYVR